MQRKKASSEMKSSFKDQYHELILKLQTAKNIEEMDNIKNAAIMLRNKAELVKPYSKVEETLNALNSKILELEQKRIEMTRVQQQIQFIEDEFKIGIYREQVGHLLLSAANILQQKYKSFPKFQEAFFKKIESLAINYKKSSQKEEKKATSPEDAFERIKALMKDYQSKEAKVPLDFVCTKTKKLMLQPVLWGGKWYEKAAIANEAKKELTIDTNKVVQITHFLSQNPTNLLQFLVDQERLDKNYFYAQMRTNVLANWLKEFREKYTDIKTEAVIQLVSKRSQVFHKNTIARHSIQKSYPNFYRARQIINGREVDCKLLAKTRKIKIDELKEKKISEARLDMIDKLQKHEYKKIAEDKNAMQSAILALQFSQKTFNKKSKDSKLESKSISYTQASTAIEIAHLRDTYGAENIEFHYLLDSKGDLTQEARAYFRGLYLCWANKKSANRLYTSTFLPNKYLGNMLLDKLINEFKSQLVGQPPEMCLFYKIKVPKGITEQDGFHDRMLFDVNQFNDRRSPYFYRLSYGATDRFAELVYQYENKNLWMKKEYRMGLSTTDDVFFSQLRGSKTAAVGPTPDNAHEVSTNPAEYTAHDEAHRLGASSIPFEIRKALERISFIVRATTGFHLTYETWMIMDRAIRLSIDSDLTVTQKFSAIIAGIDEDGDDGDDTMDFMMNNTLAKWLTVIDMVEHEKLWKETIKVDFTMSNFVYRNEVKFYKSFSSRPDFKELDIKQKLYVLMDNPRFSSINWETYKLSVPDSKDLSFEKHNATSVTNGAKRNQVYLKRQDHQFQKKVNNKLKLK